VEAAIKPSLDDLKALRERQGLFNTGSIFNREWRQTTGKATLFSCRNGGPG